MSQAVSLPLSTMSIYIYGKDNTRTSMLDKDIIIIVTTLKPTTSDYSGKFFKSGSRALFKFINRFIEFVEKQHTPEVVPYTSSLVDYLIRKYFLTSNWNKGQLRFTTKEQMMRIELRRSIGESLKVISTICLEKTFRNKICFIMIN